MKRLLVGCCLLGGLLLSGSVQASALEALRDFVKTTRSGKTTFTQVIINRAGKTSNQATGVFQFERPGKFSWLYEKPYEQLILGDGEKVWIHDRDLNQVTVRRLGGALGQSPAAILAGNDDLDKNFTFGELVAKDGLEWLEARPRAKDTTFEVVRFGLKREAGSTQVVKMELVDTFGQTSILTFARFERNPVSRTETFRFVVPKGADVLSDEK